MRKTLIICLLAFSQLMFSQEEKKSFVTFSLLKPGLSFAPRLVVGYMRQINERSWMGLEAGYGSDGIRLDERTKDNYRGFEIRPEFYYDTKGSEKTKHFLTFAIFYIEKTQQKIFSEYSADDGDYSFDRADYLRNKKGFNVGYAPMIPLGKSKSLYIMPKLGIGLSHINIEYSNVINRQPIESRNANWFSFANYGSTEDKKVGADFNLDFKIIYRF